MRHPLQQFLCLSVFCALLLPLSGCATRHFVKHEIAPIDLQIAAIQDTQAVEAENIDRADRAARTAMELADQAAMATVVVNEIAGAAARKAGDAERRADTAQVNALRALDRVDTTQLLIEHQIANLDKYGAAEQETITFKFDSDVLGTEALSRLDDLAGTISQSSTGYLIELHGFADTTGSEKYNFQLSERRATAVLRYLVGRGVPLFRISIVGLGTTNPVADNTTLEGRAQNRRVELRVLRAGMLTTAGR